MRKIKNYIEYLAFVFFNFLFLSIPKPLTKKILILLANLAYYLGIKRRKIAKANLDLVFGDSKSEEEKKQIIKNSYISLLFNMYEFLENQQISGEEMGKKVKIENEDVVLKAVQQKRKIIFTTAHYGGWEIGVPYTAYKYKKMLAVVKKMKNPYIQKVYESSRLRHNMTTIDKNNSAKELVKGIKDDFALAIMTDHHIGSGCKMEFLGKKCVVVNSAARLGLKFDAIIIFGYAVMNDFRDYTVHYCEPIDVTKLDDENKNIEYITKLQVRMIEEMILKNPDQWFWQHKRWKKYYGDIYE